jgi:hypothetical protein
MQRPSSFSGALFSTALIATSTFLMCVFIGSAGNGSEKKPFLLNQIAAGDKTAVGRFFAANQIEYDLDNFMQIAFHGQADFAPPPETFASFAWLASCLNSHSGHIFIIDEEGRIVMSEKTGCQRSVEAKEVNGDGQPELISTTSSGGTGVGATSVSYYFYNDGNFRKGLTYQKAGYETGAISLYPRASDWRSDVMASKESKGSIEFQDVNRDGFKEGAEVTYTDRFLIISYQGDLDPDGVAYAKAAKAVKDLFGERLGVEKTWVENRNWNPASSEYLKQ